MRDRMAFELDADLDQEVALTLGRVSLGLTRTIARVAIDDPEHEALSILAGLRKVELGVYALGRGAPGARDLPLEIERAMARGRWLPAMRVRTQDELSWVYFRLSDDGLDAERHLSGVYVIALDDEALTLIRLRGRLDRALAAALSLSRRYGEGDEPL
jgi:hypothetical protein